MKTRNLTALVLLTVLAAGQAAAAPGGGEGGTEGGHRGLTLNGRPLLTSVQTHLQPVDARRLSVASAAAGQRSFAHPTKPGKRERAMLLGLAIGGGAACFLGAGYGDGNLCGEYALAGMGLGLLFGALVGAAQADDDPQQR